MNEVFLRACNDIAKSLEFKPIKNGQFLKKTSTNKDIYFEIYFQTSYNNNKNYIQILPHFGIYSKALKKWEIESQKNINCKGIIYYNSLGYVTPFECLKHWNIAGQNYKKSTQEIIENIKNYIFPIFEIFNNKEEAIKYLKANGTHFNKWTEASLASLSFMIYFAKKEDAEFYLINYIKECTYKGEIIKLYEELKAANSIDLNYSEFIDADKIKLAFVNGLRIN
jgi:hypothetical protein